MGRLADGGRARVGRAWAPSGLWAHDHHALWASHAALREAGLPSDDPAGGVIRRASNGSPAGVLCEAATRLVTIHVPAPTADGWTPP